MDMMPAIKPISSAANVRLHMYEIAVGPKATEATGLLAGDSYFEVICRPEQAAQEIYALLPGIAPHDNLFRAWALELGRDVMLHPEAKSGRMFTLRFQKAAEGATEALSAVSGNIIRLVSLPVGVPTSLRGNLTSDNAGIFCDDLASALNNSSFVFMAAPSYIKEEQLIDQETDQEVVSDDQIMRLQQLQVRMLAQAQAATMGSMSAQTALLGALDSLKVQIAAYQTVAMGIKPLGITAETVLSKSDKNTLATASQALRSESRSFASTIRQASLVGALDHSQMLAGLNELRAIGMLAEKQAPKSMATASVRAQATVSTHQTYAPSTASKTVLTLANKAVTPAATATILSFAKRYEQPKNTVLSASPRSVARPGAHPRSTLTSIAKAVDLKSNLAPSGDTLARGGVAIAISAALGRDKVPVAAAKTNTVISAADNKSAAAVSMIPKAPVSVPSVSPANLMSSNMPLGVAASLVASPVSNAPRQTTSIQTVITQMAPASRVAPTASLVHTSHSIGLKTFSAQALAKQTVMGGISHAVVAPISTPDVPRMNINGGPGQLTAFQQSAPSSPPIYVLPSDQPAIGVQNVNITNKGEATPAIIQSSIIASSVFSAPENKQRSEPAIASQPGVVSISQPLPVQPQPAKPEGFIEMRAPNFVAQPVISEFPSVANPADMTRNAQANLPIIRRNDPVISSINVGEIQIPKMGEQEQRHSLIFTAQADKPDINKMPGTDAPPLALLVIEPQPAFLSFSQFVQLVGDPPETKIAQIILPQALGGDKEPITNKIRFDRYAYQEDNNERSAMWGLDTHTKPEKPVTGLGGSPSFNFSFGNAPYEPIVLVKPAQSFFREAEPKKPISTAFSQAERGICPSGCMGELGCCRPITVDAESANSIFAKLTKG